MDSATVTAFSNLYPDINPTQGISLTRAERAAITVAVSILSFGFVMGDLIIGGIGLALVLFSYIFPGQKIARRVRREARERFPAEDWAEFHALRRTNVGLYINIFWLAIIALNISAYWYFINIFGDPVAYGAAALSAFLVWFLPGMNPMWARTKPEETPNPVA